jgi:glycosyltransferase involved in cell wall biosynthesis
VRTVLVFAHECAPFNRQESTVGAQRPAQFAKHLPSFGWRAIVLCCDAARRRTLDPGDVGDVAREVAAALDRAAPDESVIIPTASMRFDRSLDRLWWAAQEGSARGSRFASATRKPLTVAKFLTGDYSQSWQPVARAAAEAIVARLQVDACVAEHTPDAGLFLAKWFSRQCGVPWIADFRDSILQPLEPAARRLYAPVARALLRSASATVNVTEPWSRIDNEMFGHPAWTIPNGFDPEEFAPPLAASPASGPMTIAYLGSIAAAQRFELFLRGFLMAEERLGPGRLRFLYRGYAAERMRAASRESSSIDAGGYVDRGHAIELMRASDLLLLLSLQIDGDPYYGEGMLPAKVFEYFGARRPILCVPGDGGVVERLLGEAEAGVVKRTPEAVADHLVELAITREREGHLPYAPREEVVDRYTRESLTGRFAELLSLVVDDAARAGRLARSAGLG